MEHKMKYARLFADDNSKIKMLVELEHCNN